MNSPKIVLTLEKTPSYLDGIALLELIDFNCFNALMKSDHLIKKYDTTIYSQKLASRLFLNERHQLEDFLLKYEKKINAFKVVYKKPKHKFGRVYPERSLGLTSLAKKTRNTLIKDKYIDIDLSNAQPKIIWNICKANEISCPNIDKYNLHRDEILNDVSTTYNVSRNDAKNLFIMLAFLGTFNSWAKELKLEYTIPTEFIVEFTNELVVIANKIKEHNPALFEMCRKRKEAKNETNFLGSMFSYYLQEYETRIMECAIQWISNNTKIMELKNTPLKVCTYEYDGFKLIKENVEIYGGVELLIENLQKVIFDELGFEMKFEVKPIEKYFEIEYTPYIPPLTKEETQIQKEQQKLLELQQKEQAKKDLKIQKEQAKLLEHQQKLLELQQKEQAKEELKIQKEQAKLLEHQQKEQAKLLELQQKNLTTDEIKHKKEQAKILERQQKEQAKLLEQQQKDQAKLLEQEQKEQAKLLELKVKQELKIKQLQEKQELKFQADKAKLEQKQKEIEEEEKVKLLAVTNFTNNNNNTFEIVSTKFEESHCKIVTKSIFVQHTEKKITPLSRYQIKTSYENMTYEKLRGDFQIVQCNFINDWLINNPNQLCYDDMGCYPTGIECPENHFNTWTPFAMELVTNYEPNLEGQDFILKHIKILCNHEEAIYDYIIKWIAQMIQYPAIKTICPILISKQGAGKGTLLLLIEKMIGSNKYFETTDPARDVWGDFNGQMVGAYFVNVNELSKKDTIACEGKIKGLITDTKLNINTKGVGQYEIQSYCRFIMTTNSTEPFNTPEDDRRMLIIRSSDEKIGNKEYFNILREHIKNINVVKTCYEYFKSIPEMDKFHKIPLPCTEYQTNLKQLSRSPIESWLEQIVYDNWNEPSIELSAKDAYTSFKNYCKKHSDSKYEISSNKLAVRLKNLKINGIEKGKHTNSGNTTLYLIPALKTHFKLGAITLETYTSPVQLDSEDMKLDEEED